MEQQDEELRQKDNYWRRMEKVIIHKKYKTEGLAWQGHDLALIKLETRNGKKVPNGLIMPACLPRQSFDDYNNDSLLMAGYGRRRIPHCLTFRLLKCQIIFFLDFYISCITNRKR